MNEARGKLIRGAMKLFDLFAASLALAFAALLMTETHGRVPLQGVMSLQIKISHALLYGLLLLIWHRSIFHVGHVRIEATDRQDRLRTGTFARNHTGNRKPDDHRMGG